MIYADYNGSAPLSEPVKVYFNSGASEGVSHIFHSILDQTPSDRKIIISSPIEHSVIPNALEYYKKKRGFAIKYVEIDQEGRVLPASLEKLLSDNLSKVA